jgi:uncharacterized protein (UPF0333 family)
MLYRNSLIEQSNIKMEYGIIISIILIILSIVAGIFKFKKLDILNNE